MLGAASAFLMLLDFPLPFVPPFVKFDFSEVPIVIAGLLLGPLGGTVTAVLKILLHLFLRGSVTIGVGELANLTGSIAYMLPAAVLSSKNDNSESSVMLLLCATLCVVLVVVAGNYFVFFPAYARLMGLSTDAFVAIGHTANASITNMKTLMIYCLLPFNLLKYGITSFIAFPLYRRLKNFRENPTQ